MSENSQPKKKAPIGLIIGIIAGIAAIAVVAIIILAIFLIVFISGKDARTIKKEYITAESYMAEYDYDNAILEYKKIIEIDPEQTDAYIGIADAYIEEAKQIESNASTKEEYEDAIEFYNQAKEILISCNNDKDLSVIESKSKEVDSYIVLDQDRIQEFATLVITKETHYKDGILDRWIEYEYDDYGNIISSKTYNEEGLLSSTNKEYNEYGELTKNTVSEPEEESRIYVNEYDTNGNLIKDGQLNENGELTDWSEYDYNSKGYLVRKRYCNNEGENRVSWKYEYDEQGNRIKDSSIESSGQSTWWIDYEYDLNGNMTKESSFSIDSGLSGYYEFEYDENNNQIKSTYQDELYFYGYEYEYDENNNLIRNTYFNEKGPARSETMEYVYDYMFFKDKKERTIDLSIYTDEFEEDNDIIIETASQSFEEDEERYKAFFENQYDQYYADLADKMYYKKINYEIKHAYADLDKDGLDELIIGDEFGVFAVVTELNEAYYISDVSGWRIQQGPTRSEYIGNGCFMANESNGNNYGGESEIDILWKYKNNLHNCGVLCRLACSWDISGDLNSKWTLFEAKDESKMSIWASSSKLKPNNPDYIYSEIDFGDNSENALKDTFNEYVENNSVKEKITFDWKSISK